MMEIHNLKMIVLYVEYDKTKYKDTLSILMNSLDKISCKKQVVVINNNNLQSTNKSDYDVLSGSNQNWEFSGWQQGYDYVKSQFDFDVVLFANDSCMNHGKRELISHKLSNDLLLKIYKESRFYGNINLIPDEYGDCFFEEKNVKEWIRTDAFIIPKTIMDKIQKIDYSDTYNIYDIIPNNITREAFINNSYFSAGLTNFLLDWFEKLWHSRFDPFENIKLFQNKTKAIINEKLLSYYIKKHNFKTLNHLRL